MRTREQLESYRDECGGSDPELSDAIDALLAGDESQRHSAETACDQIDLDLARWESTTP